MGLLVVYGAIFYALRVFDIIPTHGLWGFYCALWFLCLLWWEIDCQSKQGQKKITEQQARFAGL